MGYRPATGGLRRGGGGWYGRYGRGERGEYAVDTDRLASIQIDYTRSC